MLDSALLWSALGFFAGFLVQHWLQMGRDRRIDLERAKVPIRHWIVHQNRVDWTLIHAPELEELDEFEGRLTMWKRSRFQAAMNLLLDAHEMRQDPKTGEILYDIDPIKRKRAIKSIYRLTQPS